jgi:hypothetical protein
MQLRRKVALLLLGGLTLPATVRAGTVTIQSISGPGGSVLGNASFTSGNQAFVELVYSSVNFIDVALNVSAAGSYELYEGGIVFTVQNSTGKTWNGFTFTIPSGPASSQFTGADPDASGNFPSVSVTNSVVAYSGGTVPSQSLLAAVPYLQPAVDFSTGAAGTITIREIPSAVPEPSALAQATIASVVASVGLAWRRLARHR